MHARAAFIAVTCLLSLGAPATAKVVWQSPAADGPVMERVWPATSTGSRFVAFSVFVPRALPDQPRQLARLRAVATGETLLAFVARGEKIDLVTYEPEPRGHYGGVTSRLSPGVWHRVILRIGAGDSPARGEVDVWYDGDKMVHRAPARTTVRGSAMALVIDGGTPDLLQTKDFAEATTLADLRPVELPAAPGDFFPDQPFARPAGEPLALDAWVPKGAGPHPVVILVHGGGFVRGDKQSYVKPLATVLAQAGFAWVSIDHRLAPRAAWPAPLDDVEAAVRWVHTNAARLRLDRKKVALFGESAGAFLVSAVGVRPGAARRLAAVLPFYGPHTFELPPAGRDGQIPIPKKGALVDLFQIKDTSARTQAWLRSQMPLHNVHARMPPYLLYHAKNDSSVPFQASVQMCDAIKGAGARCDLFASEDLGHGLARWKDAPAEQERVVAWLRQTLQLKTGAR